jgi:hypothetical protein
MSPLRKPQGQRGSVLVGVIALSLAMTLAAGGLMVMSINTAKDESGSATDIQLHYAAESAMHMAAYWLKYSAADDLENRNWNKPSFVLTSTSEFHDDPGYATIEGMQVKVSLIANATGDAPHSLQALAKDGVNKGILKITWDMVSADAIAGADPDDPYTPKSNIIMRNWKESYLPDDT